MDHDQAQPVLHKGDPAKRILIVRLSAVGDTALTLPLLFGLRRHLPDAHIGWVVGETAAPLIEGLPELSRVHLWRNRERSPAGLLRLARELKREDYRISIDPQGLAVSALLPWLAGIPVRAGFIPGTIESRELSHWLMNRHITVPAERRHVSLRNLYLAQALELAGPEWPEVRIPEDTAAAQRIGDWWRSRGLGDNVLVLGIGAGWRTKIWPPRQLASLIEAAGRAGLRTVVLWGPRERGMLDEWRRLASLIEAAGRAGLRTVVLWGPRERGLLDDWRRQLGDAVTWAPSTDLKEMLALLRLARCYAGPDSAPLHLAWLLGKPTFSWFGASDPLRCAPPGAAHVHVARGPHDWRRRLSRSALHKLPAARVVPIFRQWLAQAVG